MQVSKDLDPCLEINTEHKESECTHFGHKRLPSISTNQSTGFTPAMLLKLCQRAARQSNCTFKATNRHSETSTIPQRPGQDQHDVCCKTHVSMHGSAVRAT
uniref:Uncharacterized protein n=1 Tax=Eutreptiella gymnastica TaxID=73025 RepID=A0A7S4G3R7_9EUGL